MIITKNKWDFIYSPLNYIGSKKKILDQILPLFPEKINILFDLFAGGCNVGINIDAEKIYCNDNLSFLIEMYQYFQENTLENTLLHIENQINTFQLSLENEEGYKNLRNHYNISKNSLDLFVLIAFSFNHQIRFNNSHEFNNPFGRHRSSFNSQMKSNLIHFIKNNKLKNIEFTNYNFENFDFNILSQNDFVYCDPPYLITTGTYNDGKRGFTGWNEKQEYKLLQILENLHHKNIKFALSNVLEHKGKNNEILNNWLQKNDYLCVYFIKNHYGNANYQTLVRDKDASKEVLITNYYIPPPSKEKEVLTLF